METEENKSNIQEEENNLQTPEKEKTLSPALMFLKKNPQYIIAVLFFIAGLLIKLPGSTHVIDFHILQIWALVTFALGCFFPFVITAIASRKSLQRSSKSYYFIISLIAMFSLSFGLGEFVSALFVPDFFNIAFIAYGIGGYAGVLLNRLLTKK